MSNSPTIDHGNSHPNINDQLSNNNNNSSYNAANNYSNNNNNGSYGTNDNYNNKQVNENENNLVNNNNNSLSTSSNGNNNNNNNNNLSSSLSISSSTSSNAGTNNGVGSGMYNNLDDVCRDYLRNVCRRGKLCRFKHPDDNDGHTMGRKESMVFCHDFQNRECRRENCRFLHCTKQEEEAFRATGKLPSNVQAQLNNDNSSTPVCKDFLNGTCRRLPGRCKYRHPVNDPQYPINQQAPQANRNFDGRNGGGGGQGQIGANYPNPPNVDYQQQAPYGGRPGMHPSYGQYNNDSYSDSPNKRKRPYDAMYNSSSNGPYGGNPYDQPPINQRPYQPHSPSQSYYGGRGGPAPESRSYLEEENAALRRRVDDLKKQVSELISRNDFLVEQINRVQGVPTVAVATATSVASLTQQAAPPVAVVSSTLGLTTPLSQSLSLQPQGAVIGALPPSSIVSSIASISIPTVTAPVSLVNSSGGATLVSYTPALLSSTAWSMGVEQ